MSVFVEFREASLKSVDYIELPALISVYSGIPGPWNSITRQLLLEKEKDQKYTQVLNWRSKHLT